MVLKDYQRNTSHHSGYISEWILFALSLFLSTRQRITACCSLRSTFGDVALFIAYKWRHGGVIIIKLSDFIQNEIPCKTYISDFWYLENNRIYADLPYGCSFFETQCIMSKLWALLFRYGLKSLESDYTFLLKTKVRRSTSVVSDYCIAAARCHCVNVCILWTSRGGTKRDVTAAGAT